MPIIEISSLTHPGVDVFCMLTEAQLRQRIELGKGVFIAESPNVISRALDAGYEPLALMCNVCGPTWNARVVAPVPVEVKVPWDFAVRVKRSWKWTAVSS